MNRGKRPGQRGGSADSARIEIYVIVMFIILCLIIFYNDIVEYGSYLFSNAPTEQTNTANSKISVHKLIPKFDGESFPQNSFMNKATLISVDDQCRHPVWCNIQMPTVSYFKFPPPDDPIRWRKAQIDAANGAQVFLERISKVFPNPLDFLDGDRSFRKLHLGVDIFMDERTWLAPITDNGAILSKSEKPYDWEKQNRRVVPRPYDFLAANRSPIIQVGYMAFKQDNGQYFSGNFEGTALTTRQRFIQEWNNIRGRLVGEKPYIVECALNENWGWLSTAFPNRTVGWGQCCWRDQDKYVRDFLDDEKVLMVVVGQHHNVSHPKVISIPRGLPLTWKFTEKLIWDSIHTMQHTIRKDRLLFASASSWGPRPQILRCVSSKFTVDEFEGHVDTKKDEMAQTKADRARYYEKLASAKFGLSLPGLGYDCFRTWELLTLGTVVVTERGIGFDRTFWRLPVLLVDDFADVTPDLLRNAYVEAVYRADDFEFERLKQSYWWSVIMEVSRAGNIKVSFCASAPYNLLYVSFLV